MRDLLFGDRDRDQIRSHGLTEEKVGKQIENFIKGFGYLPVEGAASVANGIIRPTEVQAEKYILEYDANSYGLTIVKFVPASGAATRMFKDLFSFVNTGKENQVAEKTVGGIENFAFYPALPGGIENSDERTVVEAVLRYGAHLPKGLIYFHSYPEGARTAFEEHLAEGAMYARSGNTVKVHFTISEEHRTGFEELVGKIKSRYEQKYGVTYDITFSVQDPATDTIAVTPSNEPFRNQDGTLLFRPAGHGALLENLNRIDADLIFIKNIDNVAPDRLKADTVRYKKLIGGVLLDLKKRADALATGLENGQAGISQVREFIENSLSCKLPDSFDTSGPESQKLLLLKLLDRPMRVCGMVKNEGEAGGGPFWVSNSDGTRSLQIAEPSQISPDKAHLLKEGTHFNPVDLVCAVKDRNGNKFDLTGFRDPATGFISEKSKDGKKLKAQELPGLWNGAMADWITLFVEVPVSTFSPVKEVTDLLRPEHQSNV
ncbi:MAG: DUF4301 family protein [Rikenellaceae bacterium]|nr:DUF4301 family protein [Rikenellaceae bacterium]